MNRRQKIIVSVTGIFIVLLILVGLTYAYFLTRIQGNEESKSISVTTANLRLVYNDGSDGVIGGTNIIPSDTVYTKTFTVKNEGNVNIEYGVYLIDVINTFERKDDIKYTITCSTDGEIECSGVSSETTFPSGITQLITNTIEPTKTHTYTFSFTYKDTGTDQSIDMNKQLQAKIQIFGKNSSGIIIPYDEDTLAYNILNNGADITTTSKSGGVFIGSEICGMDEATCVANVADGCPGTCYEEGTETITTEVKNDKSIKTEADFSTTATGSSWDENLNSYTNDGIFITDDNYSSSYYYRGTVTNNYVNFAGMCWKIVRIEGDGSVKLILEDQDNTCQTSNGNWNIPTTTDGTIITGNFGYDNTIYSNIYLINYLKPSTDSEMTAMSTAFKNFQTGKLSSYLNKLKAGNWCLNDRAYSSSDADLNTDSPLTDAEKAEIYESRQSYVYETELRFAHQTFTLTCDATIMDYFEETKTTPMYVATLTADEIVFAGGRISTSNTEYYLHNDYQNDNDLYFWTLSPYMYDASLGEEVYNVRANGGVWATSLENDNSFRPSISLTPNIVITQGDGTKTNPYIVS